MVLVIITTGVEGGSVEMDGVASDSDEVGGMELLLGKGMELKTLDTTMVELFSALDG
jgi:hypothetical protein